MVKETARTPGHTCTCTLSFKMDQIFTNRPNGKWIGVILFCFAFVFGWSSYLAIFQHASLPTKLNITVNFVKMANKPKAVADKHNFISKSPNVISNEELSRLVVSCNFIRTQTSPSYKICIHNILQDTVISKSLVVKGSWERQYLFNFRTLLGQYSNTTFLDIGAHIGVYSLQAAAMGYSVVAVEPAEEHLKLLKQSILINRFTDRITLLNNSIWDGSNDASSGLVQHNTSGPGNITDETKGQHHWSSLTLSDLDVLFAPSSVVLLKLDCDGCEERAFKAKYLFENNFVPYIMMKSRFSERAITLVDEMVALGYYAVSHDGPKLDLTNPGNVYEDVIWIHKNATLPENLHIENK
jgi:FkbM family methyltransferase